MVRWIRVSLTRPRDYSPRTTSRAAARRRRAARRARRVDLLPQRRARPRPLRRQGASRRRAPRHRQPDPGWRQIGAVWLPLPHLIQILPTQIDVFYRTGAFGSLLSVACFGVTVVGHARLVLSMTGSRLGAVAAAALLVLNPNLLYVQSTPMTEPLLLAATLVSVLLLREWLIGIDRRRVPSSLGWVLFLTAWTRYEAWPILAAAIAVAAFALWRRGRPRRLVVRADVAARRMAGGRRRPLSRAQPAHGRRMVRLRRLLRTRSDVRRAGGQDTARDLVGHPSSQRLRRSRSSALTAAAWVVVASRAAPDDAPNLVTVALFAAAALPGVCVLRGASVPDSLHGAAVSGVRAVLWRRGRSARAA